jgi:ubiquinone/menaquinone biosynthesis C-methylase UbiE
MNKSLSFDRAAGFYDRTRSLPDAVAVQGIRAILDLVGPRALILDVGTGTGRISAPLIALGANLIGCDLSPKMMAVLRDKIPDARLAEADASLLPFPANHFEAVITCHVMHLVGPWREALREYRRVLKSGGVYMNARTEQIGAESPGTQLSEFWESRVASYGASSRRPGIQNEKELHAELLQIGAEVRQVQVVRFSRLDSVHDVVERIANRIDSPTWLVPEGIFSRTVQDLREWAQHKFGDLNATFDEESVFILDVARFPTTRA